MEADLFYYRNRTNLVAVSCDQGDTIVLPSGKVMECNNFWEEVTENLRSELTPAQESEILVQMASIDTSPVGEIVRRFSRNRKAQERLDGISKEPEYRKLPDDVMVVVADFD